LASENHRKNPAFTQKNGFEKGLFIAGFSVWADSGWNSARASRFLLA
jgi:hypothetical protein